MDEYDDVDVSDTFSPRGDPTRRLQLMLVTVAACLVIVGTVVGFG